MKARMTSEMNNPRLVSYTGHDIRMWLVRKRKQNATTDFRFLLEG